MDRAKVGRDVVLLGRRRQRRTDLWRVADRERLRGYDQAALIASVAAGHLRLPVVRALERRRATAAQFELGRGERASNVAGASGSTAFIGRRAAGSLGLRPNSIRLECCRLKVER